METGAGKIIYFIYLVTFWKKPLGIFGLSHYVTRVRVNPTVRIRIRIRILTRILTLILTLTITFKIILNLGTIEISRLSSILDKRILDI